MIPRVIEAEHVRDYVIHVRFADGVEGDIDLQNELEGEIFEPLKDPACFQNFQVHPELHTITWPNGAISPRNSCTRESRCRPGRR